MHRKPLLDSYTNWFNETIYSYADQHCERFELSSLYLSRNAFFATFMFDQDRIAARKRRETKCTVKPGDYEFANFQHFYNLVCRRLLGRNYHRASAQQKPLCIAALDAEGSRYWAQMGEVKNLHLHTIWVLPSNSQSALSEVIREVLDQSKADRRLDFSEIDIKPMQADRGNSVNRLSSYTAKFIAFNNHELKVGEDLRIFPF